MAHNIRHINISNAQVLGQERAIEFDADAGTLIIYGVSTFEEALAILSSRSESFADDLKDGNEPPALGVAPDADDPLAATGEFPDDVSEVPEVEATVEDEAEDTAIYARFTKLKELVGHLKSQGYEDFPAVYARCSELINADVCPILTKVSNLEARLKNTCTLMGISLENNVA